jgi:predicted DNA-binding transcriptional regulator AlpA
MESEYLTIKQVCAHFGIVPQTLWRLRKRNAFPSPSLHIGKSPRWSRTDLTRYEDAERERNEGSRPGDQLRM